MKLIKKTEIVNNVSYNLNVTKNHNYIANGIVVSNCHTHKAKEVHKILKDCSSAKVRIGFTGTLPVSKLNMWQIQGYMGPVLKEYTASDLAKLGFISECVIDILNVKYTQKYKGEYHDIKDSVFQSKFRLNIVKEILSKVDSNSIRW